MSTKDRFRFTLGHLMGVVAASALFIAAGVAGARGDYWFSIVLSWAVALFGSGVLIYHVRLSRWLWVALAGYAGPMFMGAVQFLVIALHLDSDLDIHWAIRSLNAALSFLFIAGLAMTFRDVRRQLAARDDAA